MKPKLTLETLKTKARRFAEIESAHREPSLYGVTDGKAVGTYFEHKFRSYLSEMADEILANPPEIGYLTISDALQWRLQYGRVIEKVGSVAGVERLR
jgi:hypothetical protein